MSQPLNGVYRPEVELEPPKSLRLVWLGQSIVADLNNPIATTVRVVLRALQDDGHQVTFLERRNNPLFLAALTEQGWEPYRRFQRDFADLHYRTYDMPRPAERDVWLSREAALVDAVVVQSDAPEEIFGWLSRLETAPMLRVLIALDSSFDRLDLFDLVFSPAKVGIGQVFDATEASIANFIQSIRIARERSNPARIPPMDKDG